MKKILILSMDGFVEKHNGNVAITNDEIVIQTDTKSVTAELINEVEQLILHAEEDTLDYSVLEHARKLIFRLTHPKEYAEANQNVLSDLRTPS